MIHSGTLEHLTITPVFQIGQFVNANDLKIGGFCTRRPVKVFSLASHQGPGFHRLQCHKNFYLTEQQKKT